jgi:hypothetical protein
MIIMAVCSTDKEKLQSAFHEKVPAGGCGLWCGSGGEFTGGWTTGLLLVESGMTHQGRGREPFHVGRPH